MALVLSQRGIGTVGEILRMRTDLVLDAWGFVRFIDEYAETEEALNKKESE